MQMMPGSIPDAFVQYLNEAAGAGKASVAISSIGSAVQASLRVNPAKLNAPSDAGYPCVPVPWSACGAVLEGRPLFTLDPCFHAGAYYVQDTSSMFVGHFFSKALAASGKEDTPLAILDLCASPGGKTTDIASRMPEGSIVVANEVIHQRAGILKDNVMTWGNPDVIVTGGDPSAFGRSLESFFDVVLVDAPCSGEGMFRKDPSAMAQWSPDAVSLCSARQKRILADVWPSLKPGGILIYSTCTYNRYENQDNVGWLISQYGASPLVLDCPEAEAGGALRDIYGGFLFIYGLVGGEGQYCAAVVKTDGAHKAYPRKMSGGCRKFESGPGAVFGRKMYMTPASGQTVGAVTENVCGALAYVSKAVKILLAGVNAGVMKNRDFVPDASLALSAAFNRDLYPHLPLDREAALKFLAKENIFVPGFPKGYLTVTYDALPIGFVKNLGNRMNNLHPSSRRIRMDINLRKDG